MNTDPSSLQPPDDREPVDLRLAVEPSSSRLARRALRTAVHRALPPERLEDASLAMSEAINNVVLHAYRDRPAVGAAPISVRIWVRDATVEILVADRGGGFSPGDRAPATGLGAGLRLIDALADETQVLSNSRGTIVVMRFGPRLSDGRRIIPAEEDDRR